MTPAIHIRKDGPLFRVQVLPPEAMGSTRHTPPTYLSATMARMAATVLSNQTGWPVTDLTDART